MMERAQLRTARKGRVLAWILALVLALGLGLAGPVQADETTAPASIPVPGDGVEASFEAFARTWMTRLARARVGVGGRAATGYTEAEEDFQTRIRATGNPTSPYVGILKYVERVYECTDSSRSHCRVTAKTPIMEIFRYRDGRWIY